MSEPLSRYSKERENETDRQILETLRACLLAAVTLMLGQGTMQSYAMNAQVINSPDRIVVQDENKNTGNQNNTNTQTVTTKAEVAGFGEVSTPVTDSSSYFGKEGSLFWQIMIQQPSSWQRSLKRERAV